MDNNEIVNEESLPPMPDKPTKQLSKRLCAYEVYVREHTKQFLESPENRYIFEMLQQADSDNMNFDPFDIRDAFYEFLLTIMKNYSKFWKKSKKDYRDSSILGVDPAAKSIEELYNVQDFLSDLNMTKVGSFGYKFTETSIFSSFIENRVKDKDNQHYKFFEECLEAKKSKKETKFISYVKCEKIEDCPYPKWQIEPGIQYSYDKLPSIMNPERIRSSTDLDNIDLEMPPDTERYREESQRLQRFLEEKCVMCRGFYSIGLPGLQKDLGDNDWLLVYADLIGKLFIKNEVAPLMQTVKKCSEGNRRVAAETKILTLICQRFVEQQKTVDRMIKGWDYTESQPRYRTHLVNLAGVSQKQLSEMHTNKQVILGQHIYGDFQRIWFQKSVITFHLCPESSEGCRRLYIRIQSQIMKGILNQILHRQLQSFTRFVLQRYANSEVVVWTCQELMRFHQWLQ